MSLSREFTTMKYGFHTKWELSTEMLHRKNVSETAVQIVEGMPNVKWFLSWTSDGPFRYLHCNVESENEIDYTLCHRYSSSKAPIGPNTVFRNGTIIGKQIIQVDNTPYKKLSDEYFHNDWGLRFKQKDSTDFDIIVDGQTIHIHKLIVSVESKVFTTTFEANFKESKEKKVTITDFKYEIVQAAIDYCYGQNISAILEDQQKAIDLLYFANKYDFITLKLRQACIDFLRPLFNKKEGFSLEEIATLDNQFLIDLVSQALNH
uniref:BTB domain-containing protein n=1 Tax=Panagrolaimus sp. PS1159 TaxID=55785 RepID=A0AC35F686_9BILA